MHQNIEVLESSAVWRFTLGTRGGQTAMIVLDSRESTTNNVSMNKPAEIMIKQQMIGIPWVHSGYGTDKGSLMYSWDKFLATCGLYDEFVPEHISTTVKKYIVQRVKQWSSDWRKRAFWKATNEKFCTICTKAELKEEEVDIEFQPSLVEQAKADTWNGEFRDCPKHILCFEHLHASLLRFGPGFRNAVIEEMKELI